MWGVVEHGLKEPGQILSLKGSRRIRSRLFWVTEQKPWELNCLCLSPVNSSPPVISMLADPNDESPANVDAAKEWRDCYPEFK